MWYWFFFPLPWYFLSPIFLHTKLYWHSFLCLLISAFTPPCPKLVAYSIKTSWQGLKFLMQVGEWSPFPNWQCFPFKFSRKFRLKWLHLNNLSPNSFVLLDILIKMWKDKEEKKEEEVRKDEEDEKGDREKEEKLKTVCSWTTDCLGTEMWLLSQLTPLPPFFLFSIPPIIYWDLYNLLNNSFTFFKRLTENVNVFSHCSTP